MIHLFKKRKKKSLREVCQEMYGDDIVTFYDMINEGTPIGGFVETVVFLEMVEEARKKMNGGKNI